MKCPTGCCTDMKPGNVSTAFEYKGCRLVVEHETLICPECKNTFNNGDQHDIMVNKMTVLKRAIDRNEKYLK